VTVPYAYGIAVDDAYVYWSTFETSGKIARVPIVGGAVQPISSGENSAFDITLAAGKVFWCQQDTAAGHVTSAAVTGGDRVQLASGVAPGPARVTSDGTFLYYVTAFNILMKLPVLGGTPTIISNQEANSNVQFLRLYQGKLYYTNDGVWNAGFTAKIPGTAAIRSVNVSGTAVVSNLVPALDFPQYQIAVDGAHVFWNDDEFIYSTGMLGGLPKQVTKVPSTFPSFPVFDMLSDGIYLYFIDSHSVYRVPVNGGQVETISFGWEALKHLAMDATHLFFTDFGNKLVVPGRVVEMAK
jgi:hypothetical protein